MSVLSESGKQNVSSSTKKNIKFTSSQVIDSIEMNDTMVEITGFIDYVRTKEVAANNAEVMRIVINNGNGRRIQVLAWEKLIPVLAEVAQMSNIIRLEGVMSKSCRISSKFNDGNVNFQLEIKPYTKLEKIGSYELPKVIDVVTKVDFDNIRMCKGIVEIEGVVKNAFRLMTSKFQRIGLGSITNGERKLEIHVADFKYDENIHKGHLISVKGQLVERPKGPHYFFVKKSSDIKLLDDKKKSFEYVLAAYNYV